MAVSILLFISAVIDGDRTVLASFKILGPIPSRPVYNYFIPFCATVKTITHEVLWMTRCTVTRGRRPRATMHRVIHSTEGVIVLTVAQNGME